MAVTVLGIVIIPSNHRKRFRIQAAHLAIILASRVPGSELSTTYIRIQRFRISLSQVPLCSMLRYILFVNQKWKRYVSGILTVSVFLFIYYRSQIMSQPLINFREDKLIYKKIINNQAEKTTALKTRITIHIGMALFSIKQNPHASANFKDTVTWILLYTSAPIHFHIVSDEQSSQVIDTVMEGVQPQASKGYTYTVEMIDDVSDQVMEHLETIAPHFKLTELKEHVINHWLPLILPWHYDHLNRLIFINNQMKFRADVLELYEYFDRFESEQLMGLALAQNAPFASGFAVYRHLQNENNKNLGLSPPNGWPGFNTGLILLEMGKIRHSDLIKRFVDLENQYPLISKYDFKPSTALPTLDEWLTLVALEKSQLFYTLPCQWNVQQIIDSDAFEYCRIDIKAMALDN